jgi:hypothetical protein
MDLYLPEDVRAYFSSPQMPRTNLDFCSRTPGRQPGRPTAESWLSRWSGLVASGRSMSQMRMARTM